MLTKRNKVERMTIVNTLLTSIYEELLKGEADDIDGLLQIAVYAQVEMNRIVFDLNQRNGCEPQTDVPRCSINGTPFDECGFCEHFNCDTCQCEADTPQTEKPKIRKRIDKPFRAVWLDDDLNEIGTPQTESTGSPIGDYRDGVGAWQTDCPWK